MNKQKAVAPCLRWLKVTNKEALDSLTVLHPGEECLGNPGFGAQQVIKLRIRKNP